MVSAWLLKKRHNITKHFNLEEDNLALSKANAELLSRLPMSFYLLQDRLYNVNDSIKELQYEYFPAVIINYSNHKRNNYATINKGSLSGVKLDMGVMTEEGIVGFVIDVTKHYAIVRTILSERINIIVEINGVMGSIEWNGFDNEVCNIKGITTGTEIETGDQVVVKGSSGRFPKGMPVGEVISVKDEDGSSTLKIEVDIAADFKALSHVYVINNIFKSEQETLEEAYYE